MTFGLFLLCAVLVVGFMSLDKALRRIGDRIDNNSQQIADLKDRLR